MGIVFGRTGTAEPPFSLPTKISGPLTVEVRAYPSYVIASVPMNTGGDDQAFGILARYIGVFGEPANTKSEAMAMTSPVLTKGQSQAMAMTSPVIQDRDMSSMAFVLPFEFTTVNQAPTPKDKRVKLDLVPKKVIVAYTFSGSSPKKEVSQKHFDEMKRLLQDGKYIEGGEELSYEVAQYHPPFTLPFLRRNEVWVQLKESNPEVKKLLDEAAEETKAA